MAEAASDPRERGRSSEVPNARQYSIGLESGSQKFDVAHHITQLAMKCNVEVVEV